MTQTAPGTVRIAETDDRVIVTTGIFDGHSGRVARVGHMTLGICLDVTGQIEFFAREHVLYPDGGRPETGDELEAREHRAATLKRLHSQARTLRSVGRGRQHAIVTMAARYGAAERLKCTDYSDLDLTYRACNRRFNALQRLVYGD